jgi:hypothetical protein
MVFFFDESRFGLHAALGRCWARKGVRVPLPVNPSYQNFYVYSGVSPLTGDSFSLFLPWVNTEMMNLYLAEMSAAFPDKDIMLIWDQAGWHKSKSLKVPDNRASCKSHFLRCFFKKLSLIGAPVLRYF